MLFRRSSAAPRRHPAAYGPGRAAKTALLITAIALLPLFAGCFGTGGDPSGQLGEDPLGTGVFNSDFGMIEGYVVTDKTNAFNAPSRALKSVASATVTIVESGVFTYTNGDGYYKFTGIKPGILNISVRRNDAGGVDFFNRMTAEVTAGKTTALGNIVLKRASRAAGKVVMGDGGSAAGTAVSVEGFPYCTLCDTNGYFVLDSVPSDEYISFRFSKPGYSEERFGPVNVVAGSSYSFTRQIVLNRSSQSSRTVSGTIRESQKNSGIPAAAVRLYETAGSARTLARTAYADSAGNYSTTVEAGKSYVAAFSKNNYYTKEYTLAASDSAAKLDASLTLANLNSVYYRIGGIVRDFATSTPLAGVRISSFPGSDSFTTGEDGSFSVSLLQGNYSLTASRAGYSETTMEIIAQPYVSVTTEISIKMTANGDFSPFQVTGTVLDNQSRPAANVQVSVDKYGLYTYTDSSGGFLFNLPNGIYNLSATTDSVYFGYSSFSINGAAPPALVLMINQLR